MNDAEHQHETDGRRSFLAKAGIGVTAAWVAPTVLSTAAHAQGSLPLGPVEFRAPAASGSSDLTTITLSGLNAAAGDLLLAIASIPDTQTLSGLDGFTQVDAQDVSVAGGSNARVVLLRRSLTFAVSSVTFTRSGAGGIPFKAAVVAYRPGTNGTSVAFDTYDSQVDATDVTTHTWPSIMPSSGVPARTVVRLGGLRSFAIPASWDGVANPAANVRVQDIPDNDGSRTLHIGDDSNTSSATGSSSLARASVQYTVAIHTA